MTGDPRLFSNLKKASKESFVTFGDNKKGRILGKGSIGNVSSFLISNVLLVDGLSFNLLSISQLSDNGLIICFDGSKCLIKNGSNEVVLVGNREGNIYTIDMHDLVFSNLNYLVSKECDINFWLKRLGHVGI